MIHIVDSFKSDDLGEKMMKQTFVAEPLRSSGHKHGMGKPKYGAWYLPVQRWQHNDPVGYAVAVAVISLFRVIPVMSWSYRFTFSCLCRSLKLARSFVCFANRQQPKRS